MRVRYVLLVFAIAFALALSATAALVGSALIIGAFAAGIILSGTNQFDTIEHEVRPVASIFTPIFFVGWAAPWVHFRRVVVGVGMVPRGEVGLIFADIGRRAGVLNEAVFGAILLMIMATTFVAPPGLKLLFGSRSKQPPQP
jgi:Kef-type K+ transport system membrane component KefB